MIARLDYDGIDYESRWYVHIGFSHDGTCWIDQDDGDIDHGSITMVATIVDHDGIDWINHEGKYEIGHGVENAD